MAKHHCSKDCATHNIETLDEARLGLSNKTISEVEKLLLTIKNEKDARDFFIKALIRELEKIFQGITITNLHHITEAKRSLKKTIRLLKTI